MWPPFQHRKSAPVLAPRGAGTQSSRKSWFLRHTAEPKPSPPAGGTAAGTGNGTDPEAGWSEPPAPPALRNPDLNKPHSDSPQGLRRLEPVGRDRRRPRSGRDGRGDHARGAEGVGGPDRRGRGMAQMAQSRAVHAQHVAGRRVIPHPGADARGDPALGSLHVRGATGTPKGDSARRPPNRRQSTESRCGTQRGIEAKHVDNPPFFNSLQAGQQKRGTERSDGVAHTGATPLAAPGAARRSRKPRVEPGSPRGAGDAAPAAERP